MDFQTDGRGTVGEVISKVFEYAVFIVDKSMSLYRTLIAHEFLLCFAFLQKPKTKTFEPYLAYLWAMLRSL